MLLFRDEGGTQLTQSQLQTKYGFNQTNLDSFQTTGQALNLTHQAFFAVIQTALNSLIREIMCTGPFHSPNSRQSRGARGARSGRELGAVINQAQSRTISLCPPTRPFPINSWSAPA